MQASASLALSGLSHHLVEERTNTNKGITKKMTAYNIETIDY
jgi:hypothetical protein